MSLITDAIKDGRLIITVEKSPHLKCSRCWNHTSDVMYSSYWLDTLCGRCARVLCDLEEQGKWFPGRQNMIDFKNKHMIYPVIHVKSEEQAIRNTKIAKDAGCDGVFLINHAISPEALLKIHAATAKAVPNWWIGINCLGFTHKDMFENMTPEMSGLWMDNAGIDENQEKQERADHYKNLKEKSGWDGIYFGGVAFKYQRKVEDLETACKIAMKYVDVVTTSGLGTAQAAEVDKIERMSSTLGEWPLAIASGVTFDNVEDYLDKVTCFLVASGINKTWDDLDADLVKQLVDKVRSYVSD
jgi:hypothetical protein